MSAEELPLIETAAEHARAAADTRPEGLTLASISRDGRRMIFVDAAGREFTVEVDDHLRAAWAAAAPAPSAQRRQETPVTTPPTPLRPKDIQNRIRAGESAEEVATAAGTTVEKIMPFAGPALAEREHMAERAQRGSVRRRPGDPAGAARTLGDAVAQRLGSFYLDPDTVTWDSHRRPDGRWTVLGTYETPERSGTAEVVFDAAGNYVSLENDDARWLVGDVLEAIAPEPVRDDLSEARLRRAEAVPEPAAAQEQADRTDADASGRVDESVPAQQESQQAVGRPDDEALVPEPEPERPARPKSSRRKRASVPSWDEIMFGGKAD